MPEEEIVPASESPKSERADKGAGRLKSFAALIAAIAALLTALAAIFKPQDETMTKASYDEVKKSLADLTTASAHNHDDLVALRSYLVGYSNGVSGVAKSPPSLTPMPLDAVDAGKPPEMYETWPPVSHPTVRPPAPSAAPPPPVLHEKTAVHEPKDFSKL